MSKIKEVLVINKEDLVQNDVEGFDLHVALLSKNENENCPDMMLLSKKRFLLKIKKIKTLARMVKEVESLWDETYINIG